MPTNLDDPFGLRDKCTTKARTNIPVVQSKYIHYFTPRFVDLCTGTILLEEEKLKEVEVESMNRVKITSSFQKAFEVHDVRKRIMRKVT